MSQSPPVDRFDYTIHVRRGVEDVWRALIDPELTARYWGLVFATNWTVGSTVDWVMAGITISDPAQVVLEHDAPHRLAYTWHTFSSEWAEVVGFDEATRAAFAAEPRSRATFELTDNGASTALTLTHDGFDPDGLVITKIKEGWPYILSSLKSLLETGEALPTG